MRSDQAATNRKRIADDCPLRLAVEAKDFAEIMNQPGENEPARMAIAPDLFGGLEEMIELGKVRVGIAIVHQRIQIFQRFPDAHLASIQSEELLSLGLNEVVGLVLMIQPVKLPDGWARIDFVVPKFFLFLLGIGGLRWFCSQTAVRDTVP